MAFLRKWFWLGLFLFSLGGWAAKLQADINNKASKDDYIEILSRLSRVEAQLNDISQRQQQFYCENKPVWCR